MDKLKWIILGGALATTFVLFKLPKAVVEAKDLPSTSENMSRAEVKDVHAEVIPSEKKELADSLKTAFHNPTSDQQQVFTAERLVEFYSTYAYFDSAAVYSDFIAESEPSDENIVKAGDAWFNVFNMAEGSEKVTEAAQKALKYYGQASSDREDHLEIRARQAVVKTVGQNPMEGVAMLREILDEDPNNETALYYLGELSIRSGQYQKAGERFEKVIEINKENIGAHINLAFIYEKTGDYERATKEKKIIKKLQGDAALSKNNASSKH